MFLNIKIKERKLIKMICPAVIFANKRIQRVKGRINIPNISIGINNNFIINGTFGIQKICFQYFFLALKIIIKKIIIDNDKVTLILPVILGPIGKRPIKLFINIKQNSVKKKGKYSL